MPPAAASETADLALLLKSSGLQGGAEQGSLHRLIGGQPQAARPGCAEEERFKGLGVAARLALDCSHLSSQPAAAAPSAFRSVLEGRDRSLSPSAQAASKSILLALPLPLRLCSPIAANSLAGVRELGNEDQSVISTHHFSAWRGE